MKKKVQDIKLNTDIENEAVTKGYLRDHLASQDYVTKGYLKEYLDSKDYVTKSEFSEFRSAVVVLFDDQREQFERNIGVMIEDFRSEVRMLAEALKMQIESSDRKWEEQNRKNNLFMTNINELRITPGMAI